MFQKLKSRIVEVENSSLEAKIQFREREDELSEENQVRDPYFYSIYLSLFF